MFTALLHKSVQVGEKVFHILCDTTTNLEDLKNFATEVLKVTFEIEQNAKKASEEKESAEVKEDLPKEG